MFDFENTNWGESAKSISELMNNGSEMMSNGNEVWNDIHGILNELKSNSGFTRAKAIGKIIAYIFGGG